MKVIIQIPCFNEEKTLALTLAELPRTIKGADKVEWLIIDDGCSDKTRQVAIDNGVDYIASHVRNLGLARAFLTGIEACTHLGADLIVNTDADNQYNAADIQKLVDPILSGQAEYVIGTRPISEIEHFSPLKKALQHFGSWVVRLLSRTDIADTTSGFRAITREAAVRLHVFNKYTYTIETIIQAGQSGIATQCVPIRTNAFMRPSRLISSIPAYLKRSFSTILRSFMTYKPLTFFLTPGIFFLILAGVIGIRYLFFFFQGQGAGHIQSLLLGIMLFTLGVAGIIVGLLSDLIAVNRELLEDIHYKVRLAELDHELTLGAIVGSGRLVYRRENASVSRKKS